MMDAEKPVVLDRKALSEINRTLGRIEGIAAVLEDHLQELILDAVDKLEYIIAAAREDDE